MIIKSDLHMHTNFDDGANSVFEMIESAIDKGFETVGISGHGFTPFDLSYCIKKNASYLRELTRAKRKYAGKINVLCGIEADGYSEINIADYDYSIGSVHYFKSVKGKYYPIDLSSIDFNNTLRILFNNDSEFMVTTYYKSVVEMIKKFMPTIIGHFDLITKFSDDDNTCRLPEEKYLSIVKSAVDEILDIPSYTPIFEVNTGAIARGYKTAPYPSEAILRILHGYNIPVTLSSDAHNSENIGYYFDESIEILKNVGYENVLVMENLAFTPVSIIGQ